MAAKDTVLSVNRVEEGKLDVLLDAYDDIRADRAGAHAALKDELIIAESAFLHEIDGEHYFFIYAESEDWETTQERYLESERELDVKHREALGEALAEDGIELEPIFHVVTETDG